MSQLLGFPAWWLTLLLAALLISTQSVTAEPRATPQGQQEAPAQPQEFDFRYVGQFGGGVSAIAAREGLVFLAIAHRFVVLDARSNPAVELASISIDRESINALALGPDHAYLLAGNGLDVLDISDPRQPRLTGGLAATGSQIVVSAQHAYVGASEVRVTDRVRFESNLRVFDLSLPSAPSLIASSDPVTGSIEGMAVVGERVFILVNDFDSATSTTTGRVIGFDASTPEQPVAVQGLQVTFPDRPRSIAAAHGHVYVARDGALIVGARGERGFDNVHTIDSAPRMLGIAAAGGYAYTTDQAGRFQVYDLADPMQPQLLSSVETGGTLGAVTSGEGLAHVVDSGIGLRIMDVSDSTRPAERGTHRILGAAPLGAVRGNFAYVADGSNLWITDTTNAATTTYLGHMRVDGFPVRLIAADGWVVLAGAPFGLSIVDVTDARNPRQSGTLRMQEAPLEMILAGSYLYVVSSKGLHVIDVSERANPREVATLGMPTAAQRLAYARNRAYVATEGGQIVVVDVGSPASPRELGSIRAPGVRALAAGRYLYSASSPGGLRVYDITDELPRQLGVLDDQSLLGFGGLVEGDGYVISFQTIDLRIFDVSNPASPRRASTARLAGFTGGLQQGATLAGNRAYVPGGRAGLLVLEMRWRGGVARGASIIEDDFESQAAGWLPWSSSRPHLSRVGYRAGVYVLEDTDLDDDESAYTVIPGRFRDASLAVDSRIVRETDHGYVGLVCRIQFTEPFWSYYAALVDAGERRFRIFRSDRGEFTTLVRSTTSEAINAGASTNRAELTCVGETIALTINGVAVASVTDSTYREGFFGLLANAVTGASEPVEAHFDNLVVTQR